MSDRNAERAERGRQALALHPDADDFAKWEDRHEALLSQAADVIADVLHAVREAHGGATGYALYVLQRAGRTYDGDVYEETTGVRLFRLLDETGEWFAPASSDESPSGFKCPVCGGADVSGWADDGEADLADWWECHGCPAHGAVVSADDPTRTRNGLRPPALGFIVCPFGDAPEEKDGGGLLVLANVAAATEAAVAWVDQWAAYVAAARTGDDARTAWVEVVALGYDPGEHEKGPSWPVGFVGHERTLLEGAPELDEFGGRKVLADGEVIAAAPAQDVAAD